MSLKIHYFCHYWPYSARLTQRNNHPGLSNIHISFWRILSMHSTSNSFQPLFSTSTSDLNTSTFLLCLLPGIRVFTCKIKDKPHVSLSTCSFTDKSSQETIFCSSPFLLSYLLYYAHSEYKNFFYGISFYTIEPSIK